MVVLYVSKDDIQGMLLILCFTSDVICFQITYESIEL